MWGMTLTGRTPQWIDLDGAANARAVVKGVLVRSDNLQHLTERDLRTLIDDEQVRVVLDLRTGEELYLEGPGPMNAQPQVRVEHRSLYPESGNTDFDLQETVVPWGSNDDGHYADELPTVRAYMAYLLRRPDSITESLRAIATTDGAVLVHCAAGKDRTGVVVAMALDAAGWDRQLIVEDYLATTERIDEIMAHLRSSETYRAELEGHTAQRHAPVPGAMDRVLELIDRDFGGTVEFLRHNGFAEAEFEALRRRLTVS
jgi:hypothetical protein